MIGTTLSHYEILELLGKGGMGEVYRARDTQLDREVAVKILPPNLGHDVERLARFRREAKVLASLNHPNIAQVHGFEESGEHTFLVMELAEGEDLDLRLKRGPLPVDEAISVAHQIALGIEGAHEKGVVHRDLKPANVQLSPEGKIKVLDFGLARAFAGDEDPNYDPENSPTITGGGMTRQGVILGTAAYMSPEQARGRTVDRRADIWAFGVVFFEMLTGRQLFAGDTISDTMAAVLTREPGWSELPANTPPHIVYILRRCLERDTEERLRDIGEARALLAGGNSTDSFQRSAIQVGASSAQAATSTNPKRWIQLAPWIVALSAALLWWFGHDGGTTDDAGSQPTEFQQLTTSAGLERNPDLSSDGNYIVYEAQSGGDLDIFFQRVGGTRPINLTGNSDDDETQPRLSPDGEQVVFHSTRGEGGIFVMGATGESVRQVATEGGYPDWSPDGRHIVYCTENFLVPSSRNMISEIVVVDADGSDRHSIAPDDGVHPSWSPNGHRIAFWSVRDSTGGNREIWTIRPDGTDETRVTVDSAMDWSPAWSADGRWLYFLSDRNGLMNLWRVAIDEERGLAQSDPEPVRLPSQRVDSYAISPEGNSLVFSSLERRGSILAHDYDPERSQVSNTATQILGGTLIANGLQASPDGEWLAFSSLGEQEDIYLLRSSGGGLRRLTDDAHKDRGPAWSRDGGRIYFYSDRAGRYEIWSMRPDGGDLQQITGTSGSRSYWFPRPDPQGTRILLKNENGSSWILALEDESGYSDPEVLPSPAPGLNFYGEGWSRDGQLIVGWTSRSITDPEGELAIFEVEEERYELLGVACGTWSEPQFTREDRSIIYSDSDGLYQHDLDSGRTHRLLEMAFDNDSASDNTLCNVRGVIYRVHRSQESDLWHARLE